MKYRFKGLNEYIDKLENLSNSLNMKVCVENAVTKGSEVVAEYTIKELESMTTDDRPGKVDKRNGLRTIQKNFLLREFGVSPSEDKRQKVNRKTGVDKGTFHYPDRESYIPAVTMARMLENGTSFMPKNKVFSRASRKARTPCLQTMQESLNHDINRIFESKYERVKRRELNG